MENEDIFVPYIAYLSKNASLNFSKNYNKDIAVEVTKKIKKKISNVTLPDMIELTNGFQGRRQKDHSQNIQNSWKKLWKHCKGDKRKIRLETENYVAKEKLLPVIRKINSTLNPVQLLRLTDYFNSFPKTDKDRAFNSVIQHIPSLRNEVDVFSVAPLDNQRKVSMNDFFDLENLVVPIAYSDIFVAKDRWIRHILKNTNLPEKNNCLYFFSIEELVTYLSLKYLHS